MASASSFESSANTCAFVWQKVCVRFKKCLPRGMTPGQSVAGNPPWPGTRTSSRCFRTWARRESCQKNHVLTTAKTPPKTPSSTTADYPGACASETGQLDYLRGRATHRSGASQRRLLGDAQRRWRTEFSGASRPRKDTPFQVRNSVGKRVCRRAKEESKPRFPRGSGSRIRAHNHLHFICTSS